MPDAGQMGAPEFTMGRTPDGTARLLGDKLRAVADTQHRKMLRHGFYVGLWRPLVVYRKGRAAEDDPAQAFRIFYRLGAGLYFAIDLQLTNATRNELRVLRAEVENENLVVHYLLGGEC